MPCYSVFSLSSHNAGFIASNPSLLVKIELSIKGGTGNRIIEASFCRKEVGVLAMVSHTLEIERALLYT